MKWKLTNTKTGIFNLFHVVTSWREESKSISQG